MTMRNETLRTMRTCSVATWLLMTLLSLKADGQRQLTFDSEGKIFVVTKDVEQRYGFFQIKGFEEARLIELSDTTASLEITLHDSLGMRREARILSIADLVALRDRWDHRVAVSPAQRATDPISVEGRARLVQTVTGLGIGWYGWTIPAIVGSDNGAASMSLYLMTAGLTYVAADRLLADRNYSEAEGAAFMYFATRGILHGVALNVLIAGDLTSMRIGFAAGTAVSLIEGLGVSSWAARGWLTHGDVRSMGVTGDAGLILGLGLAYAGAPTDRPFFDDAEDRPRAYAASILFGNLAGIAGGWLLNRSGMVAPGDADLIESAGYLGSAAGFTISDLNGTTDRRKLVLGALGGLVAGHAIGAVLANRVELSGRDGQRLTLMTSGGVFVGLGIAYGTGASDQRAFYFSAATLGGVAGMLIAYLRTPDPSYGPDGVSLQLRPDGLLDPVDRIAETNLIRVRPFLRLAITL